jgi:Outer membrane protein beta-barrel domain
MKNILFLLLFISTFQISKSQDRKFHLLLSVGANASQVNGDKLAGFDKFGLNIGAGVRRSFGQKSAWQLEFLYSEKGSKDVVSTNNPVPDTLFQFNYIDVPLVYSYNFYPKLRGEIGIFNSVRLSATYSDFVIDYDRSSIIRSSDHGLLAGVQYQFGEHLGANLRISQSIFDINASIERYYNLYTSFSIRYTL